MGLPRAEYACRYMTTVVKASAKYDLEPEILVALIHEESRWKPWAVSSAGACGLTQVLPKYTDPPKLCKELKKPYVSIRLGAKTLNYWVYEYGDGDYEKGLCGYNGGYKCGKRSRYYSKRIMRLARKINASVANERAYRNLLKNLNLKINIPTDRSKNQ
jgi:soluble lytic murein transglycosylase-like protein|tara:strand:- start:2909 stop:3385 length:477 start_codon:yes stop_codon:yes gene_type:complete